MSFPQPNADVYAVGASKFFRLNTPLSSPGDLYESQQGAHVIALGPDSDISRVNVAYFDDQVIPSYMNLLSIGQQRTFAGLVAARNDAFYAPTQRPGRTLIWSSDLYNPSFRPPGFDPNTDIFNLIVPQLDVIQYFSQVPGVLPNRTDKTWLFQNIPTVVGDHPTYFMIPYYGRRYGNVVATNTGADPLNFGVFGINFTISPAVGGINQITPIRALAPLAAAAHENIKIMPSSHGVFDYLMLQLESILNMPALATIKVLVSDTLGE